MTANLKVRLARLFGVYFLLFYAALFASLLLGEARQI